VRQAKQVKKVAQKFKIWATQQRELTHASVIFLRELTHATLTTSVS